MDFKNITEKIKESFRRSKHKPRKTKLGAFGRDKGFKPGNKFSLKTNSNSRENRKAKNSHNIKDVMKNKFFSKRFVKVLAYIAGFILIVFVIYISSKAVLQIREKDNSAETVTFIDGLEKVPEVPGSEYVFKDSNSQEIVQQFHERGYTIYRLPIDDTIDDVYKYYNDNLPKYGWTNIGQVPVSDQNKKFGQYWAKGTLGLRIYSDINDIWYQKLSESEAKTFLTDVVQKEKEIKQILDQKDLIKLSPDYEWSLNIPPDYIVSYTGSTVGDYKTAVFSKISGSEILKLEPITPNSGETLDTQLSKFCTQNSYSIETSTNVGTSFGLLTQFTIKKGDATYYGYIINNSETNIVYLMYGNTKDSTLFKYILDNINAVKQIKYG